ncbi:MAG: sigma factor, partial [Candidatus Jacksonbacteria bacterium]
MPNLDLSQLTDEQIVRLIQAGKIENFGELVNRYEAKMKRYAKKFLFAYEDAEDVVQEVFIKAYTNIQSFNSSKKFS